ncbi:MAG: ATP-binding cassette domain-containing protein [Ahrensia sp.]|nr:ATP-binding cassette domain-containing protein [Ahrensia sp.]
MIVVENLHKHFGGIRAVNGASIKIETGSITGLIGPNGAGKTTLFNVIAGLYKPTSGRVLLDGKDITGLAPHALFDQGLLRTFQIAHEFSTLTVRENLMMVPPRQAGESLITAWTQPALVRNAAGRDPQRVGFHQARGTVCPLAYRGPAASRGRLYASDAGSGRAGDQPGHGRGLADADVVGRGTGAVLDRSRPDTGIPQGCGWF